VIDACGVLVPGGLEENASAVAEIYLGTGLDGFWRARHGSDVPVQTTEKKLAPKSLVLIE
jgi:hypothetical protein